MGIIDNIPPGLMILAFTISYGYTFREVSNNDFGPTREDLLREHGLKGVIVFVFGEAIVIVLSFFLSMIALVLLMSPFIIIESIIGWFTSVLL